MQLGQGSLSLKAVVAQAGFLKEVPRQSLGRRCTAACSLLPPQKVSCLATQGTSALTSLPQTHHGGGN